LDDFKKRQHTGHWKSTLWRTRFGRGYGPVVRYTMYCVCWCACVLEYGPPVSHSDVNLLKVTQKCTTWRDLRLIERYTWRFKSSMVM
jgi:hypothetical protein